MKTTAWIVVFLVMVSAVMADTTQIGNGQITVNADALHYGLSVQQSVPTTAALIENTVGGNNAIGARIYTKEGPYSNSAALYLQTATSQNFAYLLAPANNIDNMASTLFFRNLPASGTNGPVFSITQDNANDDDNALKVISKGSAVTTSIQDNSQGSGKNYADFASGSDSDRTTGLFYRNLPAANTNNAVLKAVQANYADDREAFVAQQFSNITNMPIQSWYAGATERGSLDIEGDLQIDGQLFAGIKPFRIDHPLDPANKLLQHVAHEGDEMRVVYYGQASTANGKATIVRPDWQQALIGTNKEEFTYHLTPIGSWCNLYIAEELENNQFTVATADNTDCRFSWQLTGIRHDPYAEENRVQVEVDKEPAEMEVRYEKAAEVREENGKSIRTVYEKPVMPQVSSRRKGACIHEEACKDVDQSQLISYPETPQTKRVRSEGEAE